MHPVTGSRTMPFDIAVLACLSLAPPLHTKYCLCCLPFQNAFHVLLHAQQHVGEPSVHTPTTCVAYQEKGGKVREGREGGRKMGRWVVISLAFCPVEIALGLGPGAWEQANSELLGTTCKQLRAAD